MMSASIHPDLGGDLTQIAIGAAITVHRAETIRFHTTLLSFRPYPDETHPPRHR
jgi:hypothetical protein